MLCFHKYILSKLSRMPISAGLKLMPTISFQIQHGSFIQLLLITLHTRSLTQRRSRHTAKWMWSSSAFAYFRFNSHRTRLEDPIRGDIELGGTGHRGGLITPPHPPAPLYRRKPIKSRPDKADGQQHLLPFSGWDYLLLTSSVDFFFFLTAALALWVAHAKFPCCQAN